jgi:putative permease
MIGYVVYLVVNPGIPMLRKIGLGHNASVFVVFFSVLFFSTYPIVKLVPTVSKEVENFQYYVPKVERYIKKKYREIRIKVKEKTGYELTNKYVFQGIDWARKGSTSILLDLPSYVASVLEWTFLVPLFIFFLLKDGEGFKRSFLRLVPNTFFEKFYHLVFQFNKKLGDYVFAKFVEASIVGIVITSGLLVMDIRFALLLGIIAGITNIIPYVGPVFGFAPALIVGLAEYGPGTTLGAIVILYLIANAIDIIFVFPILVSKVVDLHPLVVVLSVILGSQWLGIVGMVISIPVAASLKLILEEFFNEFYQSG